VKWQKKVGGPDDAVCLNCFKTFKSPEQGQTRLLAHAAACWPPARLEGLDDLSTMKPHDRRAALDTDFSYAERVETDVLGMRWITGTGRASNILEDPELHEWVRGISRGGYNPPGRKYAGACGELAELDFTRLVEGLDDDWEQAFLFYSGQPFLFMYMDLWTSRRVSLRPHNISSKQLLLGQNYRSWASRARTSASGGGAGTESAAGYTWA